MIAKFTLSPDNADPHTIGPSTRSLFCNHRDGARRGGETDNRRAGTADYSSLTLFLRFYASPRYAFTVSKNCFYPVPKVNSAVVVLQLREPPLSGAEEKTFFQLTRTAFEQRRKMLRSSLKDLFPPKAIEGALIGIGEQPTARPEELSLEKFLALHARLSSVSRSPIKPQ